MRRLDGARATPYDPYTLRADLPVPKDDRGAEHPRRKDTARIADPERRLDAALGFPTFEIAGDVLRWSESQ